MHGTNLILLNKDTCITFFFFFISDELLSVINGAKIESSYHSEYCLISIELKSGHTHRRKTFCKFNNSLLVM